jgi:hypothetical protein
MQLGTGAEAVLDGTASYDPEGRDLTYQWTVLHKPFGEIVGIENKTAPLVIVEPTVDGTWVVALTVSDGKEVSNRDVARILVLGITCVNNADCNDDKYCNGQEVCRIEICTSGTPVDCDDQDDCTKDSCNEADDRCDNILVPRPGLEGPKGAANCSDGTDNDCDGKTDLDDEDCDVCQNAAACDDDNDCTVDHCNNNACSFTNVDSGVDCDDGTYCNGRDKCDGNGACLPVGENPCSVPCLGECSEQNGECTPDPFGTPCEDPGDGLACTQDACDGNGNCLSTAAPGRCTAPKVCLPDCAVDATGCVAPPDPFSISCAAPSGDPTKSECILDTSGLINQDSCISCELEIGSTVLDETNFTQDGQNCNLEGWQLISGNWCSKDDIVGCVPQSDLGNWEECCSDFQKICSIENQEGILTADRSADCMGNFKREFRLRKTFDFTGYRAPEICFEVLEHNADEDEWLLVQVSDSNHPGMGDRTYCLNDGPGIDDDDRWFQVCRELPQWAQGNPAVTVTFIVHSHDITSSLKLRRISVRAMSTECARDVRIVMTEDFKDCSDPLPADWNGWTVEGTAICGGYPECYQDIPNYDGVSVEAKNHNFSMSKYVDASSLDDRITLCFWYGEYGASFWEAIEVLFDSGSGWVRAWYDERNMGTDKTCRRTCLNLSELDPAVNNHPNLGISFRLTSNGNGRVVDLAGIHLRGHVFCSDPGKVSMSTIVDNNDGTYNTEVTNHTTSGLTTRIRCTWDSITPPWTNTTEIRFPANN